MGLRTNMNGSETALVIASLVALITLNSTEDSSQKDCMSDLFGSEYSGKHNRTITGKPCMRWDIVLPSSTVNWTAHEYYCRHFTEKQFVITERSLPWCYTDILGGWEFCDVPRCDMSFGHTCYTSPGSVPDNRTIQAPCNCSVSLSLKVKPTIQLIRVSFIYPEYRNSCVRDVVLKHDGKPIELTCGHGQSVDLSMPFSGSLSYQIGLGLKEEDGDNSSLGIQEIRYTAIPAVKVTSCGVTSPDDVSNPGGVRSIEIHTLGPNATSEHDRDHLVVKGHHTNHTLKGLVIGLVVSAIVAVAVIGVITYIWIIDRKHMRSELLREYMGDDQLSSDEEKTYFSTPKSYVNAIAIENDREAEESGRRTLDVLDPAALARQNKQFRPDGCSCHKNHVDSSEEPSNAVNGDTVKIETAIVPINELENFDDLDVIANPMVVSKERDSLRTCDDHNGSTDQENSV